MQVNYYCPFAKMLRSFPKLSFISKNSLTHQLIFEVVLGLNMLSVEFLFVVDFALMGKMYDIFKACHPY